jgi:transcriptional regulator with XRE-family HTH domain
VPKRSDPQVALGRAIRKRRDEVDLSQQDAAFGASIGQARWSAIENGANPSYGTLVRMAAALQTSVADLVAEAESLDEKGRGTGRPQRRE